MAWRVRVMRGGLRSRAGAWRSSWIGGCNGLDSNEAGDRDVCAARSGPGGAPSEWFGSDGAAIGCTRWGCGSVADGNRYLIP